jgi:hypothetical protein
MPRRRSIRRPRSNSHSHQVRHGLPTTRGVAVQRTTLGGPGTLGRRVGRRADAGRDCSGRAMRWPRVNDVRSRLSPEPRLPLVRSARRRCGRTSSSRPLRTAPRPSRQHALEPPHRACHLKQKSPAGGRAFRINRLSSDQELAQYLATTGPPPHRTRAQQSWTVRLQYRARPRRGAE